MGCTRRTRVDELQVDTCPLVPGDPRRSPTEKLAASQGNPPFGLQQMMQHTKCVAFLVLWWVPALSGTFMFDSLTWSIRSDNCDAVFVAMVLIIFGCILARHYSRYGPIYLTYGCISSLLLVPWFEGYASFIGRGKLEYWVGYVILAVAFCFACRFAGVHSPYPDERTQNAKSSVTE